MVQVAIYNPGPSAATFTIEVLGAATAWASIVTPRLRIGPGKKRGSAIIFRPPRTGRPAVEEVPGTIIIDIQGEPYHRLVEEFSLTIGAADETSLALRDDASEPAGDDEIKDQQSSSDPHDVIDIFPVAPSEGAGDSEPKTHDQRRRRRRWPLAASALAVGGVALVATQMFDLGGLSLIRNRSHPVPGTATGPSNSPFVVLDTPTVLAMGTPTPSPPPSPSPSLRSPTTAAPIPVTQPTVAYQPGRALSDLFNNAGITDDNNIGTARLDAGGFSYSEQALAGVKLGPGATLVAGGFSFVWPNVAAGQVDNLKTAGQTVAVNAPTGATHLGLLGCATDGDASVTATIHYTDGTDQPVMVTLPDWSVGTLNQVVTMSYRNSVGPPPSRDTNPAKIFYTSLSLAASKQVASLTLPGATGIGPNHAPIALHLFAIAAA